MGKINFAVIVLFFILFILMVNAIEGDNAVDDSSNNKGSSAIDNNSTENSTSLKPVTASFGVYLQIVG